MEGGFLLIETHDARPGLVRVFTADTLPSKNEGAAPRRLRYAAYFDDLSAGTMHAHELLRRDLEDADAGLYRCSPLAAVAAVESLGLRHRRGYLDPTLAADPRLAAAIAAHRRRRSRADRAWQAVGLLAILLMLAKLLLGF